MLKKRGCLFGICFRKTLWATALFIVLLLFGCTSVQNQNEGSVSADNQTDMQTVVSENTENNKEALQTQEIEVAETGKSAVERLKAEIDSYFQMIEGEWVAVEYAGSLSDHLAPEDYTEEYWEERENYINTKIEENLGKEYRIESDNLISVGAISDGIVIIEDDAMLSTVTCFFHPEIPLEAPYVGLSVVFQDDTDEFHSIIIDNNGIVLIEAGNCYFRMERKTETNSGGLDHGEEEGFLYFSGEEYFPIAEGEWIVGNTCVEEEMCMEAFQKSVRIGL